MAQSNMDLRVSQKRQLYTLYEIKMQNADIAVKGLSQKICETEAAMEQEDVALVKEKITEVYG